jgi:hypothetical protein
LRDFDEELAIWAGSLGEGTFPVSIAQHDAFFQYLGNVVMVESLPGLAVAFFVVKERARQSDTVGILWFPGVRFIFGVADPRSQYALGENVKAVATPRTVRLAPPVRTH